MDHALQMGVIERVEQLLRPTERLRKRRRTGILRQIILQRPARQMLHDDEILLILFDEIEDASDVVVPQIDLRARLLQKTLANLGVAGIQRRQRLDRRLRPDGLMTRQVNYAHCAHADLFLHYPVTDLFRIHFRLHFSLPVHWFSGSIATKPQAPSLLSIWLREAICDEIVSCRTPGSVGARLLDVV